MRISHCFLDPVRSPFLSNFNVDALNEVSFSVSKVYQSSLRSIVVVNVLLKASTFKCGNRYMFYLHHLMHSIV